MDLHAECVDALLCCMRCRCECLLKVAAISLIYLQILHCPPHTSPPTSPHPPSCLLGQNG